MRVGSGPVVEEDRFPCMGSEAHVILVGEDRPSVDGLAEWARARLDYFESCWSRFRPDSELSRANTAPGEWHPVSVETVELVDRALRARKATGGLFDPTLLVALMDAGYTTSLVPVDIGPVPVGPAPVGPVSGSGRDDVTGEGPDVDIDTVGRRLRVRPGVGFDPGGIAKGFAADLLVTELIGAGAAGACVNLGGDLRVSGVPPCVDGSPPVDGPPAWPIDVEDPLEPSGPPLRRLSVSDGAVATSSRRRRRWRRPDGTEAHHLIDPRTGLPASGEVLTATVLASEGWIAEALATAALLAGVVAAADIVVGAGATGVLVTTDGVVELDGLEVFIAA